VNNDFAHLTPSAADLLSEPSEKRIRAIKSRRWVLYPRAKQALDHLSGDVQLARRFEEFSISRWAANEQFETLVSSILRNTPLRKPTVLTPKSLRRILQVTEGITANIFHMINNLAADAAQNGQERITDEVVENWRPLSDGEAAYT
jgi:hypothetical protein